MIGRAPCIWAILTIGGLAIQELRKRSMNMYELFVLIKCEEFVAWRSYM
jgi:hypothetical protein